MKLKSLSKILMCVVLMVASTSSQARVQACNFQDIEIMVMSDDLNRLNSASSNCNLSNIKNVQGENLLFLAARYDAPQVMTFLLNQDLSSKQLNNKSQTPLFFAQSLEVARQLIEAGVDLNQRDAWQDSAFSAQLEAKNWDILDLLLAHGSKIQVRDLQWAADYYHLDALNYLATNASKSLIHGTGKYFRTFFFYEKDYRDVASQLIAKGADLNQAYLLGSRRGLLDAYVDDYVKNNRNFLQHGPKVIYWLLDHGANPNAYVTRNGRTVVQHLLTRKNTSQNLEFLEKFMANGLDLDRVVHGKNVLMALAGQRVENEADRIYLTTMMQAVLRHGADMNRQNDEGRSALHWAIRWENPSAAKVLIESGIDLSLENEFGQTAYDYVRERLDRLSSSVNKKPLVQILKMINSKRL